MKITSSAYKEGSFIPRKFTCEGENISPELSWEGIPKEAKSLALILDDPDAPRKSGFTHWVVYNIPPEKSKLDENVSKDEAQIAGGGIQGKNDAGQLGYTGPCPPSGTHRYYARLYALKSEVKLAPGATVEELKHAMEGQLIEQTELMGTYAKTKAKSA
jgi:Raf kinase inhibitor-like YbhB/YbcL family protein